MFLATFLTPVTHPEIYIFFPRSVLVLAAACRVLVAQSPTAAALIDMSNFFFFFPLFFFFFFFFARAARSVKEGVIDRDGVDHSGQSANEY